MKKSSPSQLLPLSMAILMGGQSLRFGSPKAFLPYRRKSLAAYLLSEAAGFSRDVFAVGREREQLPPDASSFPLVLDIWEQRGPLSGLHSALTRAAHPALFLCGVDMPFLKREVVEGLFRIWEGEGRPDAVVPRIDGRWEPLCAVWGKTALKALEPGKWKSFQSLLSEGNLKVREVGEKEMCQWDISLESLRNFNSPVEWIEFSNKT